MKTDFSKNRFIHGAVCAVLLSACMLLGTDSVVTDGAVLAKKISVKAPTKTLYIGGPSNKKTVKLTAKISPAKAKKKVKWKSSKPKVAKVSASGKVTAKKAGITTITATTKDKAKKKVTIKITVKKYVKPSSLSVSGKTALYVGETAIFGVKFKPSSTTEKGVVWSSSNTEVATVSQKGSVMAKKPGTTNISVRTAAKNAKGKAVTNTVKVMVKEVPANKVVMTSSKVIYISGLRKTGESTLSATVMPANTTNKTLTWKSDNPAVAAVSALGKVTAKKEGIVNISAETKNGKRAVCKLTVKGSIVSVHDPSVLKGEDGFYYIYGSHTAWAKTNSLIGWSGFGNNISANKTDTGSIFAHYWNNWAGYNNQGAKNRTNPSKDYPSGQYTDLSGNQWAPDVIYNKKMKKYCLYMSVNGPDYNSVIVMATADKPDGNWTVQGPVVYSGFTNKTGVANHDYTLTDYKKATGDASLPSRYGNGSWNPSYGVNAIDPCVKYDQEGNLWMSYGSWFGGIYMLKLDENTGLRDYGYTYTYDTDDSDGTTSDPYMGIRVAGGTRASGEASYIIYKDGYYYMFLSYGGLVAAEGYNMRVFRSENITGPYTDKAGYSALRTATNGAGNTIGNIGIRLMAGYKWSCNTKGYLAQGHNSALVDADGKMYLVYHTRTDDGTEGHYVLTHQMVMSEDGWLCVLPYKYNGEEISDAGYKNSEVVGTYEYLVQNPSQKNGTCATSTYITLGADGSVGGLDAAGSWEMKEGKPYVTFTLDGVKYEGVFSYGYDETSNRNQVMTFSAVGDNNVCIWGSKVLKPVKTAANACSTDREAIKLSALAGEDFYLPTYGAYGSAISWISSDTNVITVEGRVAKVNRRLKDTKTTLTATIKNGANTLTKTFEVTVAKYDVIVEQNIDAEKISLPVNIGNAKVTWISDKPDVISTAGAVAKVINDTDVTLTAVIILDEGTANQEKVEKVFQVTVEGIVIDIPTIIKTNHITLPQEAEGFEITWKSSDESIINPTTGEVVKPTSEKTTVTLTAVIGSERIEREIIVSVLPENYTDYVYSQDFENVTNAADVFDSVNLKGGISIGTADNNKFLQFAQDASSGNRGGMGIFNDAVTTMEDYVVELDLAIRSGNVADRSVSQFVLTGTDNMTAAAGNNGGTDSSYILKLSAGPSSTVWTINDSSQTVELPSDTWVHITAVVSTKTKTVQLQIADKDTELYKGNVSVNGNGFLKGMYILSGRGNGLTKVDNIKVY